MATELAFSPATAISAISTGPHVWPSANWAHSTTGLPLPSFCCGNDSVKTEARILRPVDPVSTRIPSIIWHCVVLPGTQIVTVVNAVLTETDPADAAGPVVTLIGCTFAAVTGGGG